MEIPTTSYCRRPHQVGPCEAFPKGNIGKNVPSGGWKFEFLKKCDLHILKFRDINIIDLCIRNEIWKGYGVLWAFPNRYGRYLLQKIKNLQILIKIFIFSLFDAYLRLFSLIWGWVETIVTVKSGWQKIDGFTDSQNLFGESLWYG